MVREGDLDEFDALMRRVKAQGFPYQLRSDFEDFGPLCGEKNILSLNVCIGKPGYELKERVDGWGYLIVKP